MIPAGLLRDIGKPFSAHQKEEDIINKEYSFTDHEELSFRIIKKIPFISDYTKNLVRWHYLIRRIDKARKKGLEEYIYLKGIFVGLDPEFRKELGIFLKCDDLGKGRVRK